MKLSTSLEIAHSKQFIDWRAATGKAVAEAKATSFAASDLLLVMRSEINAMLNQLPASKA